MVKKLLALGCIAAMLLSPVRAQAFEVYSGEKVLQLCAPMDHISRPVCKTYFQGLAEATQEAEQMDICLPNLPIQAMINTTYDELKTVSPQVRSIMGITLLPEPGDRTHRCGQLATSAQ